MTIVGNRAKNTIIIKLFHTNLDEMIVVLDKGLEISQARDPSSRSSIRILIDRIAITMGEMKKRIFVNKTIDVANIFCESKSIVSELRKSP